MWIPSGNGSGGSGPIVTTPLFSVVLNSAGPAGPNVFTTWAALYAAMVAVPGGARVTVVGTQHVTAGGPYAVSGWEFVAAGSDMLDTLVIDAGASFATPCAVTFGLAVTSNTLAEFAAVRRERKRRVPGAVDRRMVGRDGEGRR